MNATSEPKTVTREWVKGLVKTILHWDEHTYTTWGDLDEGADLLLDHFSRAGIGVVDE